MRKIALCVAAALMVVGTSGAASAAGCRDAKGKFIKCPEKTAKSVKCKDAKGKFAKCGTPGAKPV